MAVATLGSIPLFPLSLCNALLLLELLLFHFFRTFVSYPKRVKNALSTDQIMKTFILGLSSLLSVAAVPHMMTDPEPPSLCDKCKQ